MKTAFRNRSSIVLILFLSFITVCEAQTLLPETVYGEWHNNEGKNEYDGMLIHRGFIEFGYRAFMYHNITKNSTSDYSFTAKDLDNNTAKYELQVLSEDSIRLKANDSPFKTYVKVENPQGGKRITNTEIPEKIKGNWYTTDGNNSLEFNVTSDNFTFRDKVYSLEDLVLLGSGEKTQCRLVVKNNGEYRMFYFKNWTDGYLQVGFNGAYGDLYKANKEYPDQRIDDINSYMTSTFPKALRGNWLKTDGSNRWSHSFYYNHAIVDKAIWKYQSVREKGKWFIITLENKGSEKIIYAKANNNNTVSFGPSKKRLTVCSPTKTNNPNYKPADDLPYQEENLFTIDSAVYSGIIRGYDKEKGQKTGMVYVNNLFTGNQESHLIKINDDGSFSVKFPLYHPLQVYARFPESSFTVYVEPGKETWQLINSDREDEGFFAGDCAQLNTDLSSLYSLKQGNKQYYYLIKNVQDYTPEDYKQKCFSIYESQSDKLDSIFKIRALSNKAKQISRLNLDYSLYENALSYNIYNNIPEAAKIDSTYIRFLTPEIYNNKLAVLTGSYSIFLNRLRYCDAIRNGNGISINHPEVTEFAAILKKKGVHLTEDEQALVANEIKFKKDNAGALQKREDFNDAHKKELQQFYNSINNVIKKTPKGKREYLLNHISKDVNIDSLIVYAKAVAVAFSDEEIAIYNASQNLLTDEEQNRFKMYYSDELNKKRQDLYKRYDQYMKEHINFLLKKKQTESYINFFKDKSLWMQDILIMQTISASIYEQLTPLSDTSLPEYSNLVYDPFLKEYLVYENKRTKAKIEANKNNTDYVINKTTNTEADKIFETITSKYKGKVIFVDFWATWCAPCRSGIKRMKPMKEELKDKDIVFVYVTNQSSPENTWQNMIPQINGEHYRVSKDEWNYLSSKFNITGIPHYTLVDKKGKVVENKVNLGTSNEGFKQLFGEHL